MCGRYTLAGTDPTQIGRRFPIGEQVQIARRFNVAPGDSVLAVTSDRDGAPRGEHLRWGLVPTWARDPAAGYKMINARAETVRERPAYRRAFERYRCLIIADGFYEWRRVAAGPKQPFHVTAGDGGPFAFAGLWSVWHDDRDGSVLRSCTIITTRANSVLSPVHDRMPVILPSQAEAAWLDPATPQAELSGLLSPWPSDRTTLRAVGPAVSDARYDGPECLADASAPAPVDQPALF